MKAFSTKQVIILLLVTVSVLIVVAIVIKKPDKNDAFNAKPALITEPVREVDPNEYWQAEGERWVYIVPNQQTADYINSAGDSLDFIYVLNPDGTGSAVSKDKKLLLFKFDYAINGDILSLNNGKRTEYFQRFNNKTYVRVAYEGIGTLKLRKIE